MRKEVEKLTGLLLDALKRKRETSAEDSAAEIDSLVQLLALAEYASVPVQELN
jgi:hypothetical protein